MSHSTKIIQLCSDMHSILDEMLLTQDANQRENLLLALRKSIWEIENLHKLKNERGAGRKLKGVKRCRRSILETER